MCGGGGGGLGLSHLDESCAVQGVCVCVCLRVWTTQGRMDEELKTGGGGETGIAEVSQRSL